MPFTEAAKRGLEHSLDKSLKLRHDHIDTEHILLGLIRDENDATRMLTEMGANAQQVRERVIGSLGGNVS